MRMCATCLCPLKRRPQYTGGIWKGMFHYEKRIKCFLPSLQRKKFQYARITGYFGLVFEEHSVREITWLSWRHRFRKPSFSTSLLGTSLYLFLEVERGPWERGCFVLRMSSVRAKTASSNSSGVKSVFEKPLPWQISADSRPNLKK